MTASPVMAHIDIPEGSVLVHETVEKIVAVTRESLARKQAEVIRRKQTAQNGMAISAPSSQMAYSG